MPVIRLSRPARLTAVALLGALAIAACGDKSSPSTPSTSGSASSGDKAAGTPVLLGLINDEQGAIALPELATGASAAVSYVNDNGGINGHPVQLVHCASAGTPESTITCANQMISKKVVAVALGQVAAADAIVKPLKEAGVPIFAVSGQGSTAPNDPEVTYTSTSQLLTFSGVFKFFKAVNVSKPFLAAPDAGPSTKTLADLVLVPAAKGAGIDLTYNIYNPAAPDFAAAVTAAKKNGSDALFVLATEGDCTNFVKTAKQLGWDKVIFAGSCNQFVKTLGAQAADAYSLSFLVPPGALATAPASKKAEVQLYIDQMKAAGHTADTDSVYAEIGFSDLMTLTAALKTVSGDVTTATAKPAIIGFKGDVFLGGAVDCSARPAPGGTCGHLFVALQAKADGTQTVVGGDFIDAATP